MAYAFAYPSLSQAESPIASLWTGAFGEFSTARFAWIYRDNPAGASMVCFLVDTDTGQPVGSAATFPRVLSTSGASLLAGIAGDFMIAQNHRSAGPAMSLQRGLLAGSEQRSIRLVYGTPNSKSAPVVRRVGYQSAPGFMSLSLPLRAEVFVRKRIRHLWLQRTTILAANAMLRLDPRQWKGLGFRARRTFDVDSFDTRFDELWSRIGARYSLVGEKRAEFLNWRYSASPLTRYRVFGVASRDEDRIDGYIVYRIDDTSAHIADFAHDSENLALEGLLARFSAFQRRAGVNYVRATVAASADVLDQFGRAGFRNHGEVSALAMFFLPGCPVSLETLRSGSWYLVPGDND